MSRLGKFIVAILAVSMALGCRKATPREERIAIADNLTVCVESAMAAHVDSVSAMADCRYWMGDTIVFIDGGGMVAVKSDGTLSMTGVASLKSSRAAAKRIARDSIGLKSGTHSRDSVVETHQSDACMESDESSTLQTGVRNLKFGLVVAIVLLMTLMAYRIWRDLKR